MAFIGVLWEQSLILSSAVWSLYDTEQASQALCVLFPIYKRQIIALS